MPKPTRMSKPNEKKVKKIVECVYIGIERGWDYEQIANRLNEIGVKPLRADEWNYLSVQQITSVINTEKSSWYKWAFDELVKECRLTADGKPVLLH